MSFTKEKIIQENEIHRKDILNSINICKAMLNYKAKKHDLDKNIPENAEILANALNTGNFEKWNLIHLEKQTHHPECYHKNENKNLFDLLEMVCDGCVANYRRNNKKGTRETEQDFYKKKGFDEETSLAMANTFIIIQDLLFSENEEE